MRIEGPAPWTKVLDSALAAWVPRKLTTKSVILATDISGDTTSRKSTAVLLLDATDKNLLTGLQKQQEHRTSDLGYVDIVKNRHKQNAAKELLRMAGNLDGLLLVLSTPGRAQPHFEPLFEPAAYQQLSDKGRFHAEWSSMSFERAQLKAILVALALKHSVSATCNAAWLDDTDETNVSEAHRIDQITLVNYYIKLFEVDASLSSFNAKSDFDDTERESDLISLVDFAAGHWNEHFNATQDAAQHFKLGQTTTLDMQITDQRISRYQLVQEWFFAEANLVRLSIRIDSEPGSHKLSRVGP